MLHKEGVPKQYIACIVYRSGDADRHTLVYKRRAVSWRDLEWPWTLLLLKFSNGGSCVTWLFSSKWE